MSNGWDAATLKKLKALSAKGLSTSEIGKKLGMSKNAIVGKLNRLGWNHKAGGAPTDNNMVPTPRAPRAATPKKAPAAKKPAVKKSTPAKVAPKKDVKKVAPAPAPKKEPRAVASKNLAMHQRIIQHSLEMSNLKPNQCRWPIGDPDSEGFHFCGAPVFVGKPYCYEHCKQAYQFTPPKKK
jgi:GcrA cell cycle regulator